MHIWESEGPSPGAVTALALPGFPQIIILPGGQYCVRNRVLMPDQCAIDRWIRERYWRQWSDSHCR